MISSFFYLIGTLSWLLIWKYANGYELMLKNRILKIPFFLCILLLILNMLFSYLDNTIADTEYEESRFGYIDSRINNLLSATSSIIVVATVVYSLTIKKLPVEFVRYMTLSFVFLLSISTPLLWIPEKNLAWFKILRNFQTVGLTYGVFLCISGIIMLLQAIPVIGEIVICNDESNVKKKDPEDVLSKN